MQEINFGKIVADIYALYDECLEKITPFHRKLDLFIVPSYLVEKILESTNLDVSGHWVCIDNFGIIHTLEEHGSPISEARRGQIAIEKEDFSLFLEVFLKPDVVKLAGLTKRTHLPLIQFEKTFENKTIVLKEIRTITSRKKNKISRLVFHTMYKIKKSNK